MSEFTIDPEFRDLLPRLSTDERGRLVAEINANGCRDSLVVWKEWNILIDGHNRYEICSDLDLPFETTELSFPSRDDVKMWMFRNQLGRRNLTDFQRAEIALRMKPVVAAQAEERRKATVGRPSNAEKESKEILPAIKEPQTRDVVAEIAGVSGKTLDKVEAILKNGNQELIEKLRSGEKADDGKKMTINKAYQAVKDVPQPAKPVVIEPLTEKQSQGWVVVSAELFKEVKDYCRKCPGAKLMVAADLRKLAKTLEGK